MKEIPIKGAKYYVGVPNATIKRYSFSTADGVELEWLNFKRGVADTKHVIVLLHGNTSSTDIYITPDNYNLVSFLLDNGHAEIWSLNWRVSSDFEYNTWDENWSLDDAALYDHPAAFACLRAFIGNKDIHVISHCLGSLTLSMSIAAGLVTDIKSLIVQSVSLFTRFRPSVILKLGMTERLFKNSKLPSIPIVTKNEMPSSYVHTIQKIASSTRHDCDNPVCHMMSFLHGIEDPTLYVHENLPKTTHDRLDELMGPVARRYYEHIYHMVLVGRAVKRYPDKVKYNKLPDNYLEQAHLKFNFPTLFTVGSKNKAWFDIIKSDFEYYDKMQKQHSHEYKVMEGYGHLDYFWGKEAHLDIFPYLLNFINKHL